MVDSLKWLRFKRISHVVERPDGNDKMDQQNITPPISAGWGKQRTSTAGRRDTPNFANRLR